MCSRCAVEGNACVSMFISSCWCYNPCHVHVFFTSNTPDLLKNNLFIYILIPTFSNYILMHVNSCLYPVKINTSRRIAVQFIQFVLYSAKHWTALWVSLSLSCPAQSMREGIERIQLLPLLHIAPLKGSTYWERVVN